MPPRSLPAPRRAIVAALLALVPALAACERQAAADIVLTGGKIFTADSARPWVQALAIRGDRIVAAGSDSEIVGFAGEATRRIALDGRTVIPGINDAHAHVGPGVGGVEFLTSAEPTPDPAFAQALDSIAVLVTRIPSGTWLTTSVGARILEDPRARRAALDRVAPAHPVLLGGWSGHGAVLNTVALREAGLLDAPDPVGGWLERDRGGVPTGRIDEYALYNTMRRVTVGRGAAPLATALREYDGMAASFGITSTQNMATGFTPERFAESEGDAALRVRHRIIPFEMTTATGRERSWTATGADGGDGADAQGGARALVSGRKWIVDGTPVERLALTRAPYADRAGWYGRANFSPDSLRVLAQEALRDGVQPMFHAVGDSAIALVFATLRAVAADSVWRRVRPRIEHGDMLMPDQLADAKALGIVVVQNPTHLALPLLAVRWGPERSARSDILKSVVTAGIPFALGSDGPMNPYLNIMLASINPANPREALTREQAVRAYTYWSAYAEGTERDKGRLMVGMLADLAVLSQDIFSATPDAMPATTSLLTLVGGRPTIDKLATPR